MITKFEEFKIYESLNEKEQTLEDMLIENIEHLNISRDVDFSIINVNDTITLNILSEKADSLIKSIDRITYICEKKANKKKKPVKIKRKNGKYTRKGLWDNINANRGSGRKPTKEMKKQIKKIKAEEK